MSSTSRSISEPTSERQLERAFGVKARHLPWHSIAVVAIIIIAAWFRLSHLGNASLTHEEALRANAAYGGIDTVWGARRLPPLQFAMGWLIQHGIGRSELLLRAPYALAGIGCVIVLYLSSRRFLGRDTALLVMAVAASHPVLVAISHKAKVFSLEALMGSVLLWAGYEAYRRRSGGSLLVFTAVGVLGIGLTFTSTLLVAAWMPLLAWAMLRRHDEGRPPSLKRWATHRRRPLRTFAAVAIVLAFAAAFSYFWLAGSPTRDTCVKFQEQVYHAWPESYAPGVLAMWLASKSYGLLNYVLGMSMVWAPLKWCIGMVGFLAVAASAGMLWKQCRPLCFFAAILTLEVILAAMLRLWPIGENQTTTFLIPLFAIAIGCGLHRFLRQMGWSPATVVMLVFCLLVPLARASKATLHPPPLEQHLRPVFAYTAAHLHADDAIFIHYETRDAYGFYRHDTSHPTMLQPYADRDNLMAFAGHFDTWMAQHRRVWFVFMLRRPGEVAPWMEYLKQRYRVADQYRFNDAATYLIERKK